MLLELEWRIELRWDISERSEGSRPPSLRPQLALLTLSRGTTGGPVAISAALVPGWTRRFELASRSVCSICVGCRLAAAPPEGDLGPSWISAGGGGLGSRGELGASAMLKIGVSWSDCEVNGVVEVCAKGCARRKLSLIRIDCNPSVGGRRAPVLGREVDIT